MKQYSRFITLAGGVLAFFSFALPWVEVYSGVELVISGFEPTIVFLIIIFLIVSLGFLGIGIYIWQSMSRILAIILIGFGLFGFLIMFGVFTNDVEEFDYGSSFVTIAFIVSLVIIGMSLMLNRQDHWHSFSRTFIIINAVIGLCCFLIVVFSLKLDLKIEGTFNPLIKYGAFLTAIGFILAIVGILNYPETMDVSESMNEQEDKTNP